MADEYRLPAALVEKMAEAAQAEYESRLNAVELQERDETVGRRVAEAVACALVDGCEVRPEWRQVSAAGRASGWMWTMPPHGPAGWRVEHHAVITTPIESIDPPLVAPFVRLEGPPGEVPG